MADSDEDKAAEQARIHDYLKQCDALSADWRRLLHLVGHYPAQEDQRDHHDLHLIDLKGRISCDYPIVQAWRTGDYAIGSDIHTVMADLADVGEVAARSNGAAQNFKQHWDRVDGKLTAAHEVLAETSQKLELGHTVHIPKTFRQSTRHVEIPWKKILTYGGVACAVLTVALTLYVMRNFLGFWAPGEGEGIEVALDMPPQEQVEVGLAALQGAMSENNLDQFMSVFADDFLAADGKSGKRELRVLLQTARTAGEFAKARMVVADGEFSFTDKGIKVSPIRIESIADGDLAMEVELLFGRRGGKYLIISGDEI